MYKVISKNQMDIQIDGQMDSWINGQMDSQMDGQLDALELITGVDMSCFKLVLKVLQTYRYISRKIDRQRQINRYIDKYIDR